MRIKFFATLALLAVLSLTLTACASQGPSDELKTSVVNNYADGAYASYSQPGVGTGYGRRH